MVHDFLQGYPICKSPSGTRMPKCMKGQGWDIPKNKETFLRCFLAVESDKGVRLALDWRQNNGEFFEAGITLYMCWRDATGHNRDDPREGMTIVLMSFLFWMVLDHLIITVQEFCVNMRSPLVKCLVGSNCLAE